MLVEKILGNVNDEKYKGYTVDYVNFDWFEIHKKLQKKESEDGVILSMRFDNYVLLHGLHDGDVLAVLDKTVLVVNILPCESIVVSCTDAHMIPKICYEIGNKHAPLFFGSSHSEFVTPYNEPTKVMLEKMGALVQVKTVKFNFHHAISATVSSHSH